MNRPGRRIATQLLRSCAMYVRQAREKRDCGPSLAAWCFLEIAAAEWEARKLLERVISL